MDGLIEPSPDPVPLRQVLVRDLGRRAYVPVWHAMQAFTDARDAANIAMDLSPFARINPCGYRGLAVTQMTDLGAATHPAIVAPVLVRELCRQLRLVPVSAPTHAFEAA